MGTSMTPMLTTTISQTKPDTRQLGVVTTVSLLSTDRPPHTAALRGRGEGDDGETPAEAR